MSDFSIFQSYLIAYNLENLFDLEIQLQKIFMYT